MFRHGTHQTQRCGACHTSPVTLAVDPLVTCRDCHEGHHAAGRDCTVCHGPADPKTAHAAVSDMHVACDNCHAADVVAQLTPDRSFCSTCHADKGQHYADRECTTCHFLASPAEYRAHLRKDAEGG